MCVYTCGGAGEIKIIMAITILNYDYFFSLFFFAKNENKRGEMAVSGE
jgi:hypothetical protein